MDYDKLGDISKIEGGGGLANGMWKVGGGTLILKSNHFKSEDGPQLERSKQLGLAREALFYNSSDIAKMLVDELPSVEQSFGNMETGRKDILMHDLSIDGYIQSGYFFGNCSPHNWAKNLPAITSFENDSSSRQEEMLKICTASITAIAKLHARYWNVTADSKVLEEYNWLRGRNWFKGEGENEWMAHQQTIKRAWAHVRDTISKNSTGVKWDPTLVACLDASLEKISFQDYLSSGSPLTIIHGDFHPANMMWNSKKSTVKIVDWEVVGVGSGPQDIAQYLISHMYPSERRIHQDHLVSIYHQSLLQGGVPKSYTHEQCKTEFIEGGVGRWMWLIPVLATMCPDDWMQFFHDQVLAFVNDNGINPSNVPMPRV